MEMFLKTLMGAGPPCVCFCCNLRYISCNDDCHTYRSSFRFLYCIFSWMICFDILAISSLSGLLWALLLCDYYILRKSCEDCCCFWKLTLTLSLKPFLHLIVFKQNTTIPSFILPYLSIVCSSYTNPQSSAFVKYRSVLIRIWLLWCDSFKWKLRWSV